ncbi:MAG TPA: site-2 protease family protein, partial [Gemmatimonadaceae bacterium]|nr:site-2 protease family protein [Gemmatimonadaceae bacterium]
MAHFLAVWPVLLAIHEAGHAIAARQQGLAVRRVTVGAGPILWRGSHNETDLVLRLVPVVGL